MLRAPEDRPLPTLGRYEIVSRLAVTATSEVFLANAHGAFGFRRTVVLKVLLPELASQPARVKAFVDEAKITSAIHHPNIVEALDLGLHEGAVFMVMEHLEGCDVRTILKRLGPLPIAASVAIASGVCSALDHAHRMIDAEGQPLELVHRDVSPSNVIVTNEGMVKLIDFGIARTDARTAHTEEGLIKGKLGYMSPEQCRNEPLDARSDVYGLGVLLYEMLTDRAPHGKKDGYELLKAVVEVDPTPPKALRSLVPDALDRITMRCLARDKNRRFSSANDALSALASVTSELALDVSQRALARAMGQGSQPSAARVAPRVVVQAEAAASPARRRVSALVVLAALGVGAVLVVAAMPSSRPPAMAPSAPPRANAVPEPTASASLQPQASVEAPSVESTVPDADPRAVPSTRRGEAQRRRVAPQPTSTTDLDAPLPP